jgi:hypothetical protein
MANLLFSSILDKTIFFNKIAENLSKDFQHQIFWCSSSKYWTKYLLEKGWEKERILDISFSKNDYLEIKKNYHQGLEEIVKLEKKYGFTLTQLITSDRFLRDKPHDYAKMFLIFVYNKAVKFLSEMNINIIISEPTPAHEVLLSFIAQELSIGFAFPDTLRIPYERVVFYKGYQQNDIIKFNTEKYPDPSAILKEFVNKKPKPKYWSLNNNIKVPSIFKWCNKIINQVKMYLFEDGTNPIIYTFPKLIEIRVKFILNYYSFKFIKHFFSLDEIKDPFIVYALQKQPETSVDNFAPFFMDQLYLIKQIAKSLPSSHKLVVKEHSNCIGDRSYSFYKKIREIPNTILLSPFEDMFSVMKKSDVVLTISGTVAYEAALLQKPSIIFTDMFYDDFPDIHKLKDLTLLRSKLSELTNNNTSTANNKEYLIKEELDKLLRNSFEGYITDPVTDISCLEEENILKIASAINRLSTSNDYPNY